MKKIFAELFEQFVKTNKREPKGMELIQLKFKANKLQREADKIIEFPQDKIKKFFDPNDPLPYYKETPGEYSRRNTPGSIENLREEMKIAYRNEFDRLTGNETAEELKEILKNLDTDGVPFAEGGSVDFENWKKGKKEFEKEQGEEQLYKEYLEDMRRKKIYDTRTSVAGGGLLKKVLKDYQKYLKTRKERPSKKRFKEIPFRKFFEIYGPENFAEGGQATSTGLNYLLGEDDTNFRVPYAGGGMGRRGFLKLLAGLGAAGAAFKTGLMSLGKGAAKPAAKVAAEAATSGAPPHFLKLVAKIKALGNDATPKYATKDREVVTSYKDYQLTEELDSGRTTIQRFKDSEVDYYDEILMEETYMSHTPGKNLADETTGGKNLPDEYTEDTSYLRTSGPQKGDIVETVDGVPEDVLKEVEAGSGNVPESFYTGPNAIKKADGGRIGYAGGKKVVEGLISLLNKKAGKNVLTTADKIKTPQKTLDREMFKKFETKYPETSAGNIKLGDEITSENFGSSQFAPTLNIPVQKEGKFTKAEYLIQRLKNTIKQNPKDKYVQDTFPGFIDELKANPALAKNENVFKELGGDLPEGQQIVVYGDDSVDFFTQKSGPGNIDRLKKLMEKHNISREKALKIMKMEPNDQVMELKMLEVANRKLNAEGGRIGLLAGGGVLKKLIMNLAKEKKMKPSEILKIMNYKSLPSKIKNLMTKEEFATMKANRLEGVEIWKDLMYSQQEMTKNIDAGKNTPAAELFEMLEKTSPGYGTVPRNISDADMLQMEQMIKNMKTKDNRQLNAKGGLANLLGE